MPGRKSCTLNRVDDELGGALLTEARRKLKRILERAGRRGLERVLVRARALALAEPVSPLLAKLIQTIQELS